MPTRSQESSRMNTVSSLGLLVAVLVAVTLIGAGPSSAQGPPVTQCAPAAGYPAATTPVAYWSTEARCAIVPPAGGLRPENFGNKFPGEAAVYMGIVHAAIYDAAVAIEGGYRPSAPPARGSGTTPRPRPRSRRRPTTPSSGCSRRSASRRPAGDPRRRLRRLSRGDPGRRGEDERASPSASGSPRRCSRCARTTAADATPRSPTSTRRPRARRLAARPGPAGARAALPGIRPLALQQPRRSSGPTAPPARRATRTPTTLTRSRQLGARRQHHPDARADDQALFWTDHDIRQWNDGLLASPPHAASTSCRPHGCWRWRTSPAATR